MCGDVKSTEVGADIEKAQCDFWSFLCVVGICGE